MSSSTPQASPGGARAGKAASSSGPATPSKTKRAGCGCSGAAAGPGPVSAATATGSAPALRPGGAGDAIGGQWHSSKRLTGDWSINEVRNAWVYVDGLSWKKLANQLDSALIALNLLGSSAVATSSSTDLREEADGMIHEMYVW